MFAVNMIYMEARTKLGHEMCVYLFVCVCVSVCVCECVVCCVVVACVCHARGEGITGSPRVGVNANLKA